MEPDLKNTTDFLLRNPSSVKKWLTLADKYMQTFTQDPLNFLLPKAHEILKPLIEVYARNTDGFLQYIMGVRDSFAKGDNAWEDAQLVYRRINGRYVQQLRRERSKRAVEKAQELYGSPPTYNARLQWISDLEHGWAQRRLSFLDAARKQLTNNRVDTETRAELLLEFWETIDMEIYEGKIPPWN